MINHQLTETKPAAIRRMRGANGDSNGSPLFPNHATGWKGTKERPNDPNNIQDSLVRMKVESDAVTGGIVPVPSREPQASNSTKATRPTAQVTVGAAYLVPHLPSVAHQSTVIATLFNVQGPSPEEYMVRFSPCVYCEDMNGADAWVCKSMRDDEMRGK